ncbi:uncharacterized protein LOC124937596 [Impatiens glandulifera]|uniref:uncharacterized protein LOC124937596 n=1 Tax=Impatiens glandulifera TaxID=253017 RepID=UPI001FB19ABE|nr:uncharacterized protein LOC124937596 [Impatiens glandulifera]
MVTPKKEEPQDSPEEVTSSHYQARSFHFGSSSTHGDAEPSTLIKDGDDTMKLEDEDDDMQEDHPNTLEYVDVLMRNGCTALEQDDTFTAVKCFSRALEIRVAHFGELDRYRYNAYYYYGYALLRHARAGANEDGLKEEENDEIDTDDTPSNDEEETDLDLAWKLLEIARIISEKRPTKSINNVYIMCALGEVNCYRGLLPALCNFLNSDEINPLLIYFILIPLAGEEVVDASTISHQSENSNSISKLEKNIATLRDYSIMLEYKIKELSENHKIPRANLDEATGALYSKVKQVEENVSTSNSTSTYLQVRHLGKVGGSVKKISAGMYSDSIQSSSSKKRKLG